MSKINKTRKYEKYILTNSNIRDIIYTIVNVYYSISQKNGNVKKGENDAVVIVFERIKNIEKLQTMCKRAYELTQQIQRENPYLGKLDELTETITCLEAFHPETERDYIKIPDD